MTELEIWGAETSQECPEKAPGCPQEARKTTEPSPMGSEAPAPSQDVCRVAGCDETPAESGLCCTHIREFMESTWARRGANGEAAFRTALGYWARERSVNRS